MSLSERFLEARRRRTARMAHAVGFETALGVGDAPSADRAPDSAVDLRCARCGGASRLETVDLRTSRGLARCTSCATTWSVLYPT